MTVPGLRDRIVPRLIEEEMRESFIDYSMSVIVQRALPDVRDGLKPVHRRILVAMHGLGLQDRQSHKKSATVVGEVLGKYHPHGDLAVYGALVRMVQDFSLRYPLVDGQGNFGSIDGDPAAAYRYTEARLAPAAMEILAEIDRDTVDWESNFDDRLQEPTVLPSRIPNLLVNGSSGIAVGMSTNVPPHNLGEVAAALRTLAKNPDCGVEELAEALPGPDFPTGAFIVGRSGIESMYRTGRGRIRVRGRVVAEAVRGGRRRLVVTELPYAVSKSRLISQIAALARRGALPDVADMRDESDREGIRLVVELKRGADVDSILAKLYRRTALETTFGAILLALDGGRQPTEFTLKELLERFRDHRLQVIRRRSRHDLEKAETDLHIVQGLLLALAHIDRVIATIRGSADRAQAFRRLRDGFGLSGAQADAILAMRLSRLTALEGEELREREGSLRTAIAELRALLADERLQLATMLEELDQVVARHGDERRTVILDWEKSAEGVRTATRTAEEDVVVTVTQQRYLKRMPVYLYRRRIAGGLSLAAMERYPGDFIEKVRVARSHGWLLAFTATGSAHFLRIDELPEAPRASRGKAIWALLGVDRRDRIVALRAIEDLEEDRYLVFATQGGLVKRTRLAEYARSRGGTLIASTVRGGDALLDVVCTTGDADLLLVTGGGRAIRFPEREVSVVGRTAQGVKGVGLRGDDRVVAMVVAVRDLPVLLATEDGGAKRTLASEFPAQRRGGLGALALPSPRGGARVVGALEAADGDRVALVAGSGEVIGVSGSDVPIGPRRAAATPILPPDSADTIVRLTRLFGEAPAPEGRRSLLTTAARPG